MTLSTGFSSFSVCAERAIGIGEHDELALAVALDALEGQVERQTGDVDAVQLAQPLLGQVDLAFDLVHRSDDYVFRLGVGVDHLIVELHFEQSKIGALGDCAHLRAREFRLQLLLDCSRLRRGRGSAGASAARTGAADQTNAIAATATAAAIRVRNRKIVCRS